MVFAVKNRKWQTGYGAFSYGQSQIERLKAYIGNQYTHHKQVSFKEEYIALLKAFRIDYDERLYSTLRVLLT
jgi:hypothetical protein